MRSGIMEENRDIPAQTKDLPRPENRSAHARKLGIEVEFAGLCEKEAAQIFADSVNGTIKQDDKGWTVENSHFGSCAFYLDTKYRDEIEAASGKTGLDAARLLVPVELVTDPFDPTNLPLFDRAIDALRKGGATGSRKPLVHGFGVHLNVEVERMEASHVAAVTCTYALLEPALRDRIGIDLSRRALPFVDPYPDDLVEAFSEEVPGTMRELAQFYLTHTKSRNHGLDLLPVLSEATPETVSAALPKDTKLTPRPAYHFRLPESRIDEEGWRIADAWQLWMAVENLAADEPARTRLRRAHREWRETSVLTRRSWTTQAHEFLKSFLQEQAL